MSANEQCCDADRLTIEAWARALTTEALADRLLLAVAEPRRFKVSDRAALMREAATRLRALARAATVL